jgi:uncharacterized protein YbjT (DUF2867 family)
MADASKAAGVERFIWSTLPNVSKETHGDLTAVKHFDSKAAVEEYIRSIGQPASFFMPGLFMSYPLPSFKKVRILSHAPLIQYTNTFQNDEGVYTWTTPLAPEAKIPLFDPASDTGLFVAAQLLQGESSLGKRILGSSGYQTPGEIAATFEKVTGKKAGINHIPLKVFHGFLPPATADDLAGNMQLVNSPGYYVGEPASALDDSIKQVEKAGLRKPVSWEEYIKKNPSKVQ